MGDTSSTNQGSDIVADDNSATFSPTFFTSMAAFFILLVILGFGSTYGMQLLKGKEISGAGIVETDWVIHVHAIVFFSWMILLLVQTVFVAKDKVRSHIIAGKSVGIGLAVAALLTGSLITYAQIKAAVTKGLVTWAEWQEILLLSIESWLGLVLFIGLTALGLFNRERPQAHKRYMMFATIMIVYAATSRMGYLLGPWNNAIGMWLMVVPFMTYDIYSLGRIHSVTAIGTTVAIFYYLVKYLPG